MTVMAWPLEGGEWLRMGLVFAMERSPCRMEADKAKVPVLAEEQRTRRDHAFRCSTIMPLRSSLSQFPDTDHDSRGEVAHSHMEALGAGASSCPGQEPAGWGALCPSLTESKLAKVPLSLSSQPHCCPS